MKEYTLTWLQKVKSEVAQSARLFATPWTAAYQAPLSMGFSRLEYWSGVPLPSPRFTVLVLDKELLAEKSKETIASRSQRELQ